MPASSTHGILNPRAGEFELHRRPPHLELADVVEHYWLVRWDRRGLPAHEQETLPSPCVHLVIGTHRPGVHGPATARFVATLEGAGWVVGVRFRPGGFQPLLGGDVAGLRDRVVAVGDFFGREGAALERDVHDARDDDTRMSLVESFLLQRGPVVGADGLEAARIVDLVRGEPAIVRVADVAARSGLAVRALERLFRAHVGVSPKWVVRRCRVHEAAERVKAGAPADWTALALELGYFDQAHFIRDFRAQVGRTPAEYARRCAAGRPRR